jgi:hypothetical protein
MRGNMLAGIPRATQLRARELAIPAAAVAAISQGSSTVSRLGGRFFWNPEQRISAAYYGDSNGAGGVPQVGGAVGVMLDWTNAWGVPGTPDGIAALKNFTTGWLTSATGSIVDPTSFSSTGVGGVVPSAAVPFTGGAYYIRIAGNTTCASGLRYTLSAGGTPSVLVTSSAGSFDFTAVLVLTGTDRHFFQNQSAGTTTIDWSRTQIREMVPSTALANALGQATGINKGLVEQHLPWVHGLQFDGVNDSMATAPIAGTATECFIHSIKINSLPALGYCDTIMRSVAASAGTFFCRINPAAGNISTFGHDGTAYRDIGSAGGQIAVGVPTTITNVKGASRVYTRKNGVEIGSGAFILGAQPAPVPLTIGTAASFSPATYYCTVWLPTEPSVADVQVIERACDIISGRVPA